MSPALELALFVILGAMLCAASAFAGAFWWRSRSVPFIEIAQLARDLAERQRALERMLEKLEASKGRKVVRFPANVRADRAQPVRDSTGPTLISVPDLAGPPNKTAQVAAEMSRRFGSIWALADQGASSDDISRTTGQPVGQVELILGLRHPKGT